MNKFPVKDPSKAFCANGIRVNSLFEVGETDIIFYKKYFKKFFNALF